MDPASDLLARRVGGPLHGLRVSHPLGRRGSQSVPSAQDTCHLHWTDAGLRLTSVNSPWLLCQESLLAMTEMSSPLSRQGVAQGMSESSRILKGWADKPGD